MDPRHSVRFLVLAFATLSFSSAHADYEQWKYWWASDPSTKFSTEAEAVEHMQTEGHPSNEDRTERGPITYMDNGIARRAWSGKDKPPIYVNEWIYRSGHFAEDFSSEAAVVAAIQTVLDNPYPPCDFTQFDVDAEWATQQSYLTLPNYQTKSITYNRETPWYNPNTQEYECLDPPANPAATNFYRVRTAQCPAWYTPNSAEQICKLDGYDYTDSKPNQLVCEEGNPCDVGTGAKLIRETDYTGPRRDDLVRLRRVRESHRGREGHRFAHPRNSV
jgi:hypothetical protein